MAQRGATGWNAWLAAQERQLSPQLAHTRDVLLGHARLQPGNHVLDLGAGRGLVALGAASRVGPSGRVVALDIDSECLSAVRDGAHTAGLHQISVAGGDAVALPFQTESFAAVLARSVLQFLPERRTAIREAARVLRAGGRLVCAEPLNCYLTPHHHLIDLAPLGELGREIRDLFTELYTDPTEPMLTFDERDLAGHFADAGLADVGLNLLIHWERPRLTREQALARLTTRGAADRPSIMDLVTERLGSDAAREYATYFVDRATAAPLAERHGFVFVWGHKPASA